MSVHDADFRDFCVRVWNDWVNVAIKVSMSDKLEGQQTVYYTVLAKGPTMMELRKLYAEKD